MLKDRLIQSPHCPHGETEPLKREGAWTCGGRGGVGQEGELACKSYPQESPSHVLPGKGKTGLRFLQAGMQTSRQLQAQLGWEMGQAGPEHIMKGPCILKEEAPGLEPECRSWSLSLAVSSLPWRF